MVVVACVLPVDEDRIWLVRRALRPAIGRWSLAGGFVEPGESVEEAAEREAVEELGVAVQLLGLVGVYVDQRNGHVVHVHRCTVLGTPVNTPEAYGARAFTRDEVPWQELAFASDRAALSDHFAR